MDRIPDIDEMIADCEKSKKENEVIVFAVGTGRIYPKGMGRKMKKAMKEAMEYIISLEGFVGFHPVDLWHTMLLFETLNNAKGARNNLKAKGISVGQVVPIVIEEKYLGCKDASEDEESEDKE